MLRPAHSLALLALAVFLLSHACGVVRIDPGPGQVCADEPPAPAPLDLSGSRLKARWRVGEDGSRELLGHHDAALDADCIWGTTADGQERCLPAGEEIAGSIGSFYADAACEQDLVLAPLCEDTAPRFGLELASLPCGLVWRLFAVEERWEGDVFQHIGGDCKISVLAKSYGVWVAGPEIAPEAFVAGVVEVDP